MNKRRYLCWNGIEYDLSEWLTTTEFIKKYRLKNTSVINNWINRGNIPRENVIEIPELNYLRLVKIGNYK